MGATDFQHFLFGLGVMLAVLDLFDVLDPDNPRYAKKGK